jgi:hypothetical protein
MGMKKQRQKKEAEEREKRKLQHEISVVNDVIASMPAPFRKEFGDASRRAGVAA